MLPRWIFSLRTAVLLAVTGFTLSLHYMVLPFPHWVHLVHRRLCYVPILLGALWFGLRGGLFTAIVISAVTAPLALRFRGPLSANQDFIEILFYLSLGALLGFLSDRAEAQRKRAAALEGELREADRLASLGRLAAGVAHEVRTPLASMLGAADILGEDLPPGSPKREFAEILKKEGRRLERVVAEFLDLGRPLSLERSRLDAGAVLREVSGSLEKEASERGLRVLSSAAPGLAVSADGHRLHQALANLLRNALQSSPAGGTVLLKASREEGGVLFQVEDEGPGVPSGEAERIFEPFFTGRREGTGLGLALVRRIAEAHGGRAWCENRPEGGSRFSILLPLHPSAGEEGNL